MKSLGIATVTVLLTASIQAQSTPSQSANLTPEQQRVADAQLAPPRLYATVVASLELAEAPLAKVVESISKASGITVRYHSAVTSLEELSTVKAKFANTAVEDVLT